MMPQPVTLPVNDSRAGYQAGVQGAAGPLPGGAGGVAPKTKLHPGAGGWAAQQLAKGRGT